MTIPMTVIMRMNIFLPSACEISTQSGFAVKNKKQPVSWENSPHQGRIEQMGDVEKISTQSDKNPSPNASSFDLDGLVVSGSHPRCV